MVTWECPDCGAEFEVPEGTIPTQCPECGATNPKIKPPAPPGGIKVKP